MHKPDPSTSLNGQAGEPAKKPRKTKKQPAKIPERSFTLSQAGTMDYVGRQASDIKSEDVTYLVAPWFPSGELSLIAGQPMTGKSSLAAWLFKQTKRAALLPGFEESVANSTLPRLKANGVDLKDILCLDDREYRLPRDKKRILEALCGWQAKCLILDPIDSYMEDGRSENDGVSVREFLESAFWLAVQARCAVIGIRHPGKDPRNIMPGSRAWRAVPRSVVHLIMDTNQPPRRYLIHDKDSHGNDALPHRYELDGLPGFPRRFRLLGSMAAGNVSLGREVSDPTERVDVRRAGMYVRRLFEQSPEPLVKDWKAECLTNGVSDRARREAYRLLNIHEKPGSAGGNWIMYRTEKDWPSWTEPEDKSV